MVRPAGCVLIVLLACCVSALPAAADEEQTEIWVFEKGPVQRELDLTHMSAELRAALLAQLEAGGWKRVRVSTKVAGEEEGVPAEPPPAAQPPAPPVPPPEPKPESSMKKDLEELVRRGGRLPEGFQPHGMPPFPEPVQGRMRLGLGRAVARLVLRYLEVKGDPVRAPVYEVALRQAATGLTAAPSAPDADPVRLAGTRLMAHVLTGISDPETGHVYREIRAILHEEMSTAAWGATPRPMDPWSPLAPPPVTGQPGPSAPPLPPAPPYPPVVLGGAVLEAWTTPGGARALRVAAVPEGSLAQEMGLRTGDMILEIDGSRPDWQVLKTAQRSIRNAGQLSLRVKRKDGQIEQLDIEFEVEDRPEGGEKR